MSESQLEQEPEILTDLMASDSQLFNPSEIHQVMLADPTEDMFASMLSGFKFMVPRAELQIEKTKERRSTTSSIHHEIGQSSSEV